MSSRVLRKFFEKFFFKTMPDIFIFMSDFWCQNPHLLRFFKDVLVSISYRQLLFWNSRLTRTPPQREMMGIFLSPAHISSAEFFSFFLKKWAAVSPVLGGSNDGTPMNRVSLGPVCRSFQWYGQAHPWLVFWNFKFLARFVPPFEHGNQVLPPFRSGTKPGGGGDPLWREVWFSG